MLHAALLALASLTNAPAQVASAPDAEYEVAWREAGWQAPNRAQGFRVAFTGDGMRLSSLDEGETAWDWGLSLLRYGRPGSLQAVGSGSLQPSGRRAERPRPGIVEWYVNAEEGLEHGFTLAAPPRGSRDRTEIFIEMALTGSLTPTFSTDGQAIDFRGASQEYALRYGKLEVFDASGRRLVARMEGFAEPGAHGVRIRFDDEDARYPVTVDPMTTTAAWTVESNQNNAQLGIGLSGAGDVNGDGYSDVIVSAPIYAEGQLNEGKVWVHHGSPSGPVFPAWSVQGDQVNAQLGTVVETAGDVNGDGYGDVLVGSPNFDVAGITDAGKIDLYLGSSTGLSTTPAWTSAGTTAFQGLGGPAVSAGDVNGDGFDDVLVGEAGHTNGQSAEGRALLYLGSASGLAASPSWSVEGNRIDALMGSAVAAAGDVNGDGYGDVLVGAVFWNNGQEAEGRADVYLGSASGLSTTPVWTKESNQVFALFGSAVGTAGDVNGDGYADILVGASGYTNGQAGEGAAFVYLGSPGGPATTHAWMVESNQAPTSGSTTPTEYGGSVSTAGDVNGDGYADVVVGAVGYDDPIQEEGVAFLYLGSASGLSTTHALRYRSGQLNAQLGRVVRGAGDVNGDGFGDLLVSSSQYDNGQSNEGCAFLYLGAGGVLVPSAAWTGAGGLNANFGFITTSAGDVDGDGYSDILVGSPTADPQLGGLGRVQLYLGSVGGPALAPAWTAAGTQSGELLGKALALAGDVNGDGYSDVVVGSPQYNADTLRSQAGRAYLYLGSAAGLSAAPSWTIEGTVSNEWVGLEVASAGDVNGDGYADVLVSTAQQLRLYLGSTAGLSGLPAWTALPGIPTATYRAPIASAGDVNGDGFSDVIVGSPGYTNNAMEEGRALVYLGTPTGLTPSAVWSVQGSVAARHFGAAVGSAGDVNGDGYSDVVVGTPGASARKGQAFVYLGSAAGLSTTVRWFGQGQDNNLEFGSVVAGVGDVNLDGYGDFVIGSSSAKRFVWLYLGSQLDPSTDAAATLTSEAGGFACSAANAGDVNGDAVPDLIVGAHAAGAQSEGAAFVYYGNQRDGFDRRLRQRHSDGSGPIHFLGKSGSETSFRIAEQGVSPAGRGKIRLEWEVRPLGTPFDGTVVASTPLADSGAPGPSGSVILYDQIVTGLEEGTRYKWRTRIASSNPLFPRSPWKSMPNNAITETKLRTAGCVDTDGDGYGSLLDASCLAAEVDCNDDNGLVWATPGTTSGLVFTSKTELSWSAPSQPGTAPTEIRYDTLLSASVTSFNLCVESNDGPNRIASDPTLPAAGQVFFYVNRARNTCPSGRGSLGTTSAGAERLGSACP